MTNEQNAFITTLQTALVSAIPMWTTRQEYVEYTKKEQLVTDIIRDIDSKIMGMTDTTAMQLIADSVINIHVA